MLADFCAAEDRSEAWVERHALSKGRFDSWRRRGIPVLPEKVEIQALARTLEHSYEEVLMALLTETGYLPEESDRTNIRRRSERARQQADLVYGDMLIEVKSRQNELALAARRRTEQARQAAAKARDEAIAERARAASQRADVAAKRAESRGRAARKAQDQAADVPDEPGE